MLNHMRTMNHMRTWVPVMVIDTCVNRHVLMTT